jgi:methylenetetrahydrofolate reductase (NADPH)
MKTFRDFYAESKRPVFSFEVFPPRSDKAEEKLHKVIPKLVELRPDFMTVTYGAGGTTQEKTLDTAKHIQDTYKLPTACHLTCVGASRDDLNSIITKIHDSGIRSIVALRGDAPQDAGGEWTPAPDGLSYGAELVAHIRALEKRKGWEPFGIAVGGYPEKHQEAASMEVDLGYLKAKVEAGADAIITQLFYDNAVFKPFAEKARAIGIEIPIVPGLMPILSAKQIFKITDMCGSMIPDSLAERLHQADEQELDAEDIGSEHCIEQMRELLSDGVPGIHFYVLNRAAHMRKILKAAE